VSAFDAVVIGGGYAGLCAAWRLGVRGLRVAVVEAESLVASHSSARNASIWLPVDDDATTGTLARESAVLLDGLVGRDGWLRSRRAIVTADDELGLGAAQRGAERSGCPTRPLGRRETIALCPALEGGAAGAALEILDAGELDPAAMCDAVHRAARDRGAIVRTGACAERIDVHAGVASSVVLADGSRVDASRVIVAAGAWSGRLGEAIDAAVPLVPLRRHLALLATGADIGGAIVWHVEPECYFRPEPGGVLASPCDEEPFAPSLPPTDPAQLAELARRVSRLAPVLVGAGVRRSWACLRTFAPDRELVVGPDPRVRGLAWLAGFGGRGMTVAPAAAELLAALLLEHTRPAIADAVRPDRVYRPLIATE
jgi:D-arginine dehydrogenase